MELQRRKRYNRDHTCPVPRATRWRQSNDSFETLSESTSTKHYSNYLQFSEELIEANLICQESALDLVASTILQSRLSLIVILH